MKGYYLSYLAHVLFFIILLSVNGHRIKEINNIEGHINNPDHDKSVDHDSFLGVDEAKSFNKLSPEVSKLKLKKLIESKVDTDGNGLVSESELYGWINHIAKLTKEKERDEYFPIYLESPDALLDIDSYKNRIYGGLSVDELDDVSKANLALMFKQDDRKWKLVDENHDDKLDRNEFLVFQHPEDYPKMKSLIIEETMEISDKNNDGFLDLNEYLNDIWPADKEQPEQELIQQEKETFSIHRDRNKDNKLDREEVGEWLMPTNYDPADAETKHLMHIADINNDGKLSIEEILNSYDTFVGSQATDYGNTLKHEEL